MKEIRLDLNRLDLKSSDPSNDIEIRDVSTKDVAVIGIAGRFGHTKNINEFWEDLLKGKDFIRPISEKRRKSADAFIRRNQFMGRLMNGEQAEYEEYAYLDDIDEFDSAYFGISPREAAFTDPGHRIFLETANSAFEDAGYGGSRIKGSRTGIFVGDIADNLWNYFTLVCFDNPENAALARVGNINSVLAGRIAYIYDLKGPAVMMDTACSSSLVAIHAAVKALNCCECDMALAGGVNLMLMPLKIEKRHEIGILSESRRTNTFDHDSDGTGLGEGAAAVLLKPLHRAIDDSDNIYAVIKGSAVNQDGASIGITAPSKKAQTKLLLTAWKDAGINPETLSYIEVHGTGTKLGDPIEIKSIEAAVGNFSTRKQFLAVGSVKSNIGHLDSAAGIAGFIKTVLCLKYRKIPPSIHFKRPNDEIGFIESPVYVADREIKLENKNLRCGISAFGLSGTNCHIVLEEAPLRVRGEEMKNQSLHIFTLSADNEDLLLRMLRRFDSFRLDEDEYENNIASICYTMALGRKHMKYRLALAVNNTSDLKDKIKVLVNGGIKSNPEMKIYFGGHTIVPNKKGGKSAYEISSSDKKQMSAEAEALLDKKCLGCGEEDFLSRLCSLYVRGADINWNKIYNSINIRKVSLPGYEYNKSAHWFINPDNPEIFEHEYYKLKWINRSTTGESLNETIIKNVIVFKDKLGYSDRLTEKYKNSGSNVYTVIIGDEFKCLDNNLIIRNNQKDYNKAFNMLQQFDIDTIIHMSSINDNDESAGVSALENNLELGLYSLYYLSRALLDNKYKHKIKLALITRNADIVDGTERKLVSAGGAAIGIVKAFNHEFNNIRCKCIDVSEFDDMDNAFIEIGSIDETPFISYRKGNRYVQIIDKADFRKDKIKVTYKDKGVYVVTGGLGGIGSEICGEIVKKGAKNIAVIGRSEFPVNRSEHAGAGMKDDIPQWKIDAADRVWKSGGNIDYYSADVSDFLEMDTVIKEIRDKYGSINGIIHCAGIAGEGFLINKEMDMLKKVIKPKIHGAWILNKLTESDDLDFFVLFSSTTALFGYYGQSDYTAANMFLVAYASYLNTVRKKSMALIWPAWKETGMAVRYGTSNNKGLFHPVTTKEGLRYFEESLGSGETSLITARINFETLAGLDGMIRNMFSEDVLKSLHPDRKANYNNTSKIGRFKEPVITGMDPESYTDVQKKIAFAWANVLGIDVISIYSNFSDLGGDSISGARLIRELDKEFPDMLDITDIYTYPNVFEMSQYLEGIHGNRYNHRGSELDNILDKLEEGILSVDEVSDLIEKI